MKKPPRPTASLATPPRTTRRHAAHRRRSPTAAVLWLALLSAASAGPALGGATPIGTEFAVSPGGAECMIQPDVAVAPNGRFAVTWTNATGDELFYRPFDAELATISSVISVVSGTIDRPAIAVDNFGDVVLFWETMDPTTGPEILGQRISAAGVFLGSPFVPGVPGRSAARPKVASIGAGNFVVAWREGTAGAYAIKARLADDQGAFAGPEITVAAAGSGGPSLDVAYQPGGAGFIVSWADGAGKILARRYNAGGFAIADAFDVNGFYTQGDHGDPSVAASAGGEVYVSWIGPVQENPQHALLAGFNAASSRLFELALGDSSLRHESISVSLSNEPNSYFATWGDVTPAPGTDLTLSAAANSLQSFAFPDTSPNRSYPSSAMDDRERTAVVWEDDPDADGCSSIVGLRQQVFRQTTTNTVQGSSVHSIRIQEAWKQFRLTPAGPGSIEVRLVLEPGQGLPDADLLVRIGDFPTPVDFDCRPFLGTGLNERCVVDTDGSPVYVAVNGYSVGEILFSL
ncbi:MAG: hypothetical protein AAFX50_08975, partial [Acidobacteriota bacterium]